jgi:2-dehydro-3-deoxygluconokinase
LGAGTLWRALAAHFGHHARIGTPCGGGYAECRPRRAKANVSVSFDFNFRAKLWAGWGSDPAGTLRQIVDETALLFADDRALSLVLGPPESSAPAGSADSAGANLAAARFQASASAALKAFPRLRHVANLARTEHNVDRHDISAMLASRDAFLSTRAFELEAIVDRIGTGDAFAAGLLHGFLSGMDERNSLEFALAAGCLKHSIPGDFNLVTAAQVGELLAGKGFAVRR